MVILAKEMTFIAPPPTTAILFLKSVSSIIIVVWPKENIAPPYDAKPRKNCELYMVTLDSATTCKNPPLRSFMYLTPGPVV